MVVVVEGFLLPAVGERLGMRREQKAPLCNFTLVSESESADLTSVYLVSAVNTSHDIRKGIKLHHDDVAYPSISHKGAV